jgi:5-methylcytosine-specific restriction endonuclease McrA
MNHTEYMQEWRKRNSDREKEIQRECYARNREDRKRRMREYRAANRERVRAEALARHNRRFATEPEYREKHRLTVQLARAYARFGKSALSRFYQAEIAAFYRSRPVGMDVDHIHPLRIIEGKEHIACGLHVPWNLQYLTPSENKSKGRKLETHWRPT